MRTINAPGVMQEKQRGMTLISWIVVIAFLGFQAVLFMNVIPVYISDNSVKTVMETMENDSNLRTASSKKIKSLLIKKLKINNIYSIKGDNISIKKVKLGRQITIKYEPRGTLIGNLDYIVTFQHEAIIRK